jgi:hypothetical protein
MDPELFETCAQRFIGWMGRWWESLPSDLEIQRIVLVVDSHSPREAVNRMQISALLIRGS